MLVVAFGGNAVQARAGSSCIPEECRRAYVTTLVAPSDHVLGPRVLAQSLREAGARAQVVVVLSRDRADSATLALLKNDGFVAHVMEPNATRKAHMSPALMNAYAKAYLWSLTGYDRVVYFDPHTIATKSTDNLFACEGFCAVFPGSSSAFHTDVMVLEPSTAVHQELRQRLDRLTGHALRAPPTASILSEVLSPAAPCPVFNAQDDAALRPSGEHRPEWGSKSGSAFPHSGPSELPLCSAGEPSSAVGTCYHLPYTYAAPSEDFQKHGEWRAIRGEVNRATGKPTEPHVIRFSPHDQLFGGLALEDHSRPLLWRWGALRARLPPPYGTPGYAALAATCFLVPCALLLAAYIHLSRCVRASSCSLSGTWPGPSAKEEISLPVAIMAPPCSPPGPWGLLQAPPRSSQCAGFCGKGRGTSWGASCTPPGQRVVLCTAAALFGGGWYAMALRWSRGMADSAAWSPAAGCLAAHAW